MKRLLPLLAIARLFYRLGAVCLLLLAAGCFQNSLRAPGVERVSLGRRVYIRASQDIVNRRCQRDGGNWDDGSKRDPSDASKQARCCTVLRRDSWFSAKRYAIWVAYGEEECLAHEEGHIEIYERDGYRFIPEHHKALHEFGFGHERKSLGGKR